MNKINQIKIPIQINVKEPKNLETAIAKEMVIKDDKKLFLDLIANSGAV